MVSRIILSAVLVVALVGSAGVAAAGPSSHAQAGGSSGSSPACDTPSQGLETSAFASNNQSVMPGNNEINPGVVNALITNGCIDSPEDLEDRLADA